MVILATGRLDETAEPALGSALNPLPQTTREPMTQRTTAIVASDAPPRVKPSNYPEPFASRMAGRVKQPLGDLFGITNFGVNLTRLLPGAVSALHHSHSRQDELVYVLEGSPTLVTDVGETLRRPGMVAGFAAGGTAHHLESHDRRL